MCLQAKYLLPYCCMRHFLKFDMQHDHILKKLNFVYPGGPEPGFQTKSRLICFISIVPLSACKNLEKIFTTDLVIAKINI